jgi:hypothetical protein
MATEIRAIPTLYGETAKSFESEAKRTEQNPGTQDYRHEAKVVSDYIRSVCWEKDTYQTHKIIRRTRICVNTRTPI